MRVSVFEKALYGIFILTILLVAISAVAQPAYAYVDPGSGLFALQVVGSTFAGIGFMLRRRIRRFLERFGKKPASVE